MANLGAVGLQEVAPSLRRVAAVLRMEDVMRISPLCAQWLAKLHPTNPKNQYQVWSLLYLLSFLSPFSSSFPSFLPPSLLFPLLFLLFFLPPSLLPLLPFLKLLLSSYSSLSITGPSGTSALPSSSPSVSDSSRQVVARWSDKNWYAATVTGEVKNGK